MKNKKIKVALTFDTDDDIFDPTLMAAEQEIDKRPTFDSFLKHAREIRFLAKEVVSEYLDVDVRCTWFVRVDDEIKFHYGSAAYLIQSAQNFMSSFRLRGDEIGYHPHLYRISRDGARSRDITDSALVAQFKRNLGAFTDCLDTEPVSTRIGEAFFCEALATEISRSSLQFDCSAMPGRVRNDQFRSLDWIGTPGIFYTPSLSDYRIAALSKDAGHDYSEIPMSMIKIKCSYDAEPYYRYVDFSFHHDLIRDELRLFLMRSDYLVVMTHPAGIFPKYKMREHGLIAFTKENFRQNLINLCEVSKELNVSLEFCNISEIK